MTRIQDSFTRPNGNLPGITPDAWSWVNVGTASVTSFQVSGMQLVRFPNQTTAQVQADKQFLTNDQFCEFGTVSSVSGSGTANMQIRLNFDPGTGSTTGYNVQYVPFTGTTGAKFILSKSGGDPVTAVTVNSSLAATDTFKWRVTSARVGATQVVTCYVNDVQIGQLIDNTATLLTGKYLALNSYLNSARKDAGGFGFYMDDMKAGDISITSRYSLGQFDGTNEIPLVLESVKDGTTVYTQSYVDYVVGEADAIYPTKYNAGYYNS